MQIELVKVLNFTEIRRWPLIDPDLLERGGWQLCFEKLMDLDDLGTGGHVCWLYVQRKQINIKINVLFNIRPTIHGNVKLSSLDQWPHTFEEFFFFRVIDVD